MLKTLVDVHQNVVRLSATLLLGVTCAFMSGCATMPANNNMQTASPHSVMVLESLLDSSSEVVSIHLVSEQNVEDVKKWVHAELPVSAVLKCHEHSHYCHQVASLLHHLHVPVEQSHLKKGSHVVPHVDLMFDRFISQTCSDPAHNLSFGCAVSTNTLKIMTDRKQLLSPLVLAPMDAATAIDAIQQRYLVVEGTGELQVSLPTQ